jgi:hypothetical protein
MSAASNYTEENHMAALCDGVPYPLPTGTWISLHTAAPGKTGANEVTLDAWPAYVRRDAEQGGAIGTGWTTTANGERKNAKQLTYPSFNPANLDAEITIVGWTAWDAPVGGNPLFGALLETDRLHKRGDVFVFDIHALTAKQS